MRQLGHRLRDGALTGALPVVMIMLVCSLATYMALVYLGLHFFVLVLACFIGVFLLFKISTRDLSIALILWLLTMSGFQHAFRVPMPGLPDLSIDRLLLMWILVMFMLQIVIYKRKLIGPFTLDILVVVHTVYIMVNMIITQPDGLPFWVASSFVPAFAYMYGRHILKSDKQIAVIFGFILALSIYYSITAIGEHFGLDFLVWPKQILDPHYGHLWHPGRSRGPVMHPPLFGQLISMMIPVVFLFLARRGNLLYKALIGGSLLLSFAGLFLAYTRGPWLATAASLPVLGILRPQYRRILGGLAVLGLVIGTLGLFQLANSDFLQERLNSENTMHNRLAFFIMSTKMIADNPLFGVGYFNAKNKHWLYNEGGDLPFFGHVSKRSGRDTVPHDIYLGRAADEGLVSIAMLAAMFILTFREFLRKWRANPQNTWFNRNTMAAMAAVMVSYLVGGMVIDYRYFDLINVIFYLFMGLIYAYPIRTESDTGPAHA